MKTGKQVCLYFIRRTTQPGHYQFFLDLFITQKKPYSNQATPKKILPKFSYPQKTRSRKFQTQNILPSSPSLENPSPPPPSPHGSWPMFRYELHRYGFKSFSRKKTYEWYPPRAGQLILVVSVWLAPWAGKMNQIARRDWLPERAR